VIDIFTSEDMENVEENVEKKMWRKMRRGGGEENNFAIISYFNA
jgi:hypothetical protein